MSLVSQLNPMKSYATGNDELFPVEVVTKITFVVLFEKKLEKDCET